MGVVWMRRTEMKVSFIVPVYNSEKYLKRCLGSILASTYKDIEIIVVDDGSTDSSPDIIKRFAEKDSRIRSYRKENEGPSEARNFGLEKVTGEYVWFVDSDDWINPDGIARLLKYIKNNIDIVIFDFDRVYGTNRRRIELFKIDNLVFEGKNKDKLLLKLIGPTKNIMRHPYRMNDLNPLCNKIYKMETIKDIRMQSLKKTGGEDLLFNIEAFYNAGSIEYIGEALYFYNKTNQSSVTSRYYDNDQKLMMYMFSYIRQFIEKNNLDVEMIKALNNRKVLSMLGFVRNIVKSDMSNKEKRNKIIGLFNNTEYMSAFQDFDFSQLSFPWNVFYLSASKRRANIVLFMGEAMEKARKIIFFKN